MIYSVAEYSEKFLCKGKKVSPKTIIARCKNGMLPSAHHAKQLPSESGDRGQWVIEVPDADPIIEKEVKPPVRSLNTKHYSW